MNIILYTKNIHVNKFIKENGYDSMYHRNVISFIESNIDDEFLTLLKIKFGDDIKTYSEICNDPTLAYQYARTMLKERFLDGEAAIAADPVCSLWYAKDVIKSRFPLGETVIKNSSAAYQYESAFNITL